MQTSKPLKGFTLIELLIVVAIITVISAVIFAAFRNARNRTNFTHVLADMDAISTASQIFFNNNGYYPSGAYTTNPGFALSAWPTPPCAGWSYLWVHGILFYPDVVRVTLRDQNHNFRYFYCIDQGSAPDCNRTDVYRNGEDIKTLSSKIIDCSTN